MSLEKRIADALHAADTFQPSPDLFTRLQRSIEEDLAHSAGFESPSASSSSAL